jgi:regulator of sigma E protease
MTLIYFIFVLCVTVFIHELGHFLFAKKAGVHVYEFSLGMGPKLLKKNRKGDETDYCLRLFPIGGFVAMAGEDTEDEDVPKEKQLIHKKWKDRFLTIIAGVLFNFLLAFVLLFLVGLIAGVPKNQATVSHIEEGYALSTTNMKEQDKIISMDGHSITSTDKLIFYLTINGGKETTFTVKHTDGTKEEITIAPTKIEDQEGNTTYRFGLEVDNSKTHDIKALLLYPFEKTYSLVEQLLLTVKSLLFGQLSVQNLSGPVGIYSVVGESAKAGFINILYLIAYLCINVGFINLLPFPAFDGGRALFLLIEKIRGKAISSRTENMIHSFGFYLLMALMVFVTCNDILRLLG